MKTISIYLRLSSVAIGVFLSTLSYAQQIKDVFVLVDQSGTMSNSTVNNEAKQIIGDMITGQLSLSDWESKGWNNVSAAGTFFNASPSQMIKQGGKLCLIPFGNMDRVRDYSIETYSDNSSVQQFLKTKFPTVFIDGYTYLNLAKAYTVHIAFSNNIIGSVYMIIYTDGMGDYAKTNTYPDDLQRIIDVYGTDAMSSLCKKKGVLRKQSNHNYDIEVWELGPIPQPPIVDPPLGESITITQPKEGVNKRDEVSWEKGEEHTIKWKGSAGTVSINVQRKEANDKYSNIPNKERKDYYKVDIGSNAAKIKFFEPGDYHLIVADSKGRDERYVHVPTPFPFFTIMIIIAVIGGIIVLKKIINHPIPEPGPHGNNNSDDWE